MTQLVLGAKPMTLESLAAADDDSAGVIDYGNIKRELMGTRTGKDNRTVIKSLFNVYKHAPDENGGSLSSRQNLLEPN